MKTDAEKLAEIVALCKRYSHSGVEPGAHALAWKVLVLAGEREEVEAGK